MPGMDGLEVCRRLKESEATRETPLMFISGAADVEQRVQGLAWERSISSPSRSAVRNWRARVRTHLELGRLRANLEKEVAHRTAELRASEARLASGVELAGLGFFEVGLPPMAPSTSTA